MMNEATGTSSNQDQFFIIFILACTYQPFQRYILYMTVDLGRVNFLANQIIGRSSSGQERYVNRWGTEQYYWNDITSLIHIYTRQLRDTIIKLHKITQSSDAEIAAERKARQIAQARALQAERKLQNMSQEISSMRTNEEVQQYRNEANSIRSYFQEECDNLRRKLNIAQNEISALKIKKNDAESTHLFSQDSGNVSMKEKQAVQQAIIKFIKSSKSTTDKTREIRDELNSQLGKEWGVVVGISNELSWAAQFQWSKWMIFKSNKSCIFVWQLIPSLPPPPPAQTEYQIGGQYGDTSEDDQIFIQICINTVMNSNDGKSKSDAIKEILNAQFNKGWGVIVGLKWQNWSCSYSYEKWLYFRSNQSTVLIFFKAEAQEQAVQAQIHQENKCSQTTEQQNNEGQKAENEQTIFDGLFHEAAQPLEDDYVSTAKGGDVNREEQVYIEVLLEKLMLPKQNPFERATWVEEMVAKKYGDKWGIIVNVPLHDWADSQKYNKWYIYESKHANLLVWSNKEEQKLTPIETTNEEGEQKEGELNEGKLNQSETPIQS